MKHITRWWFAQQGIWYVLVLLSLVTLALLGRTVESQAGWLAWPAQGVGPATGSVRGKRRRSLCTRSGRHAWWRYVRHSWPQPVLRSVLLSGLWLLSGGRGWLGVVGWPWVLWLWQGLGVCWPQLCGGGVWRGGRWLLWQGQRALFIGYLGLAVYQARCQGEQGWRCWGPANMLVLGVGCQRCGREEPWVEVTQREDGGYQATVCGHFTIQVAGDDPLRARLLMLFLRLLDVPGRRRGSRRTRDGRTPFVSQMQASRWFRIPHPDISRVEGYWLRGAWPELLSQCTPEILTVELVRRIATLCATFPHWGQEQVYRYLQEQGVQVSQRQVRQAIEQSGWSTLRQELLRRYHWTPEGFRVQEEWLVSELLRQIEAILACQERGPGLPAEEQLALDDVQRVAREMGMAAEPPLRALPWLLRVQQVVFGVRQPVEGEPIHCPVCGSTHLVRKSRQGRQKRFYDAQGQLQQVTVYRYYCRNPACRQGSFTHFPAGLVPYSRHRLEVHLLAWQAYAWGYSTYRRVGQALQVSAMTIYRWVSAWGAELLPVAALFGVVRSSGVVGVDEKYVLVPKNDKPAAPMKRWMYVYLAVDVYTYDLLHIALYPHNTAHSAHAFLLALRGKGYHPRVVVTDLRRDYGAVIAHVFPQARHHECLFHAEQEIGRYLQKTWGRDYAQRQPEAEQVRVAVVDIFRARTQRTARKRYQALLNQRQEYIQRAPPLQWVFDFLEQHWPTLVNAVESDLIPATNNAVEMVIRRFDQHYQNFCGFESLHSAQLYLGVFEKLYRCTPFSDDAQPAIRGQSPLQLAGYDLSRMPMTWLCRGYTLAWPLTLEATDVPNL